MHISRFADDKLQRNVRLITLGVFLGLTLFTLQSKVGLRISIHLSMANCYSFGISMTSLAWADGFSAAWLP